MASVCVWRRTGQTQIQRRIIGWKACTFKAVMVMTDREKLKKQIGQNERDMTSKFNKVPWVESWQGRKETFLGREIWMESVKYLVVLYWCWFPNLDGCCVRVLALLTCKQYLGVMNHYVCILPSEGSLVVLNHVCKSFTVPPIWRWTQLLLSLVSISD